MTPQRKTLLIVAAMLVCANAVALAVMNHKPAPTPDVWFGYAGEMPYSVLEGDPRLSAFEQMPFRLTPAGAMLNGRSVPYGRLINNFGDAATSREVENCHHFCIDQPWFAWAIAEPGTSLGTVIDAARAIRGLCNVEVVVFGDLTPDAGLEGMPIFFAPIEPEPTHFSNDMLTDSSLMYRRLNETLDQFGERTGCARVSPLRP